MEILLALPIIGLLYGGGFAVAFAALVIASFRRSRSARIALGSIAIVALVAQGGCWHLASEIGRATGGGGGSVIPLMLLVGGAALVWSVVLIASTKGERTGVKKEPNLER